MNIRNKNFICKKMQIKDIKKAFKCEGKAFDYLYDVLVEQGYMRKTGDRYFSPTEKLLNEAFLPKVLVLDEFQRRYLSNSSYFYKIDLCQIFGGDLVSEQIVKKLIKEGYVLLDDNKRYRKSITLEDFLAEGEDTFYWGKGEE